MVRVLASIGLVLLVSMTGCERRPKSELHADQSNLKAATDVFWALQKQGYLVAKQKPQTSSHGCRPFEYLAQKSLAQGDNTQADPAAARFRISVFECPTTEKAVEIIEHAHTRHVDSLLRNRHEGGVLRRRALQIIIRKEHGPAQEADHLLKALGAL